jgi:hypothetical protein
MCRRHEGLVVTGQMKSAVSKFGEADCPHTDHEGRYAEKQAQLKPW